MNGGSDQIRSFLHSLVQPASHEQYVRDQKALTDLFKEPGFFLTLQLLAADKSLPQPERHMASVISGRELETKWRSKMLVPEARKPEVRQTLFSFLEEEDFGIARPQLGLLVSVARIELPRHFPNLPQLLLNPLLTCLSQMSVGPNANLSPAGSTLLINSLWTISALVKEWRTVKLTAGAEVMKMLESVLVEPVGRVLQIWAESQASGLDDWVTEESGRLAFKILARFALWHWGKAKGHQTEEAIHRIHALVHHTAHYTPVIHEHRLRLISTTSATRFKVLQTLYKLIRAIGKWWRSMIGIDPKGFCKINGTITGVGWWWGQVGTVVSHAEGDINDNDAAEESYPKRFLLLGLLLFKDVLPILSVDHANVFTPDFVLSALRLLIDKMLPLTTTDLDALEEEPEEWSIREVSDEEAWAFEFRPCAERVLIALNNACRHLPATSKVIEPEVLRMLQEAESVPPAELPVILRREALYCAIGRLSRSMSSHGGLDFRAFLTGTGSWLGQDIPGLRILKRRLAWLIGQWVQSEEECAQLDILWQILVHLLSERGESSDRAVNLAAVTSIKESVDLWDVDIAYFIPHLQTTTSELIKVLGECITLDGKRQVNDAIGVVIERTGEKILPFLPDLARSIPTLWHGAASLEGEWLFKASLVVLTQKLVGAAKASSGQLMELVIPLIEESLIPPAKDFFEEDGLILWQASLYNAASPYEPTPATGLIRLVPGLLNMLSHNMDLLDKALGLLESYLLLDAPGMIQQYGPAIASALAKALALSKPNSTALRRLLATLSLSVRVAPLSQWAPLLLDSDIFANVIAALEDDKASGLILAAYLEILARLALVDPAGYLGMIKESAMRQGRDFEKLLDECLDAIWRNFDYVGDTRMRKAVGMAAARLLTTGHHLVLERIDGEFMNIFLDVLGELSESQDEITGAETNLKPWKDEHPTLWSEVENTPEGDRRNALENEDPAFKVPFKAFLIEALHRANEVGMGPYWDKADAGTKHSLEKFLS
ncbi:armadillo-type protein [Kockovaella imperatae]|uniref:Armadillo-type protein n=1 Tax=Kockovaella imperatae TaxID=4999 RepID=A0A1Y1UFZ6_9TREE|nr:armadillo-type protein [Kockovaella imperatae]ORX36457.1 armadillo-type protein [Kockovaella imperatae]